jgi:hypothetical protein
MTDLPEDHVERHIWSRAFGQNLKGKDSYKMAGKWARCNIRHCAMCQVKDYNRHLALKRSWAFLVDKESRKKYQTDDFVRRFHSCMLFRVWPMLTSHGVQDIFIIITYCNWAFTRWQYCYFTVDSKYNDWQVGVSDFRFLDCQLYKVERLLGSCHCKGLIFMNFNREGCMKSTL